MSLTRCIPLLLAAIAFAQDVPLTGVEQPSLKAFDDAMLGLIQKNKSAGAVLAIVRDGRLVLARGYGYADPATQRPIEPEGLIRIASVSKALTAVALDGLVAEKKITLDQTLFGDLLPGVLPASPADPRVREIKVGHLASHTAGLTGDPRCDVAAMVQALDPADPPTSHDLLRFFGASMRLRAAPGALYEYSNPGYGMLGRAMEAASGESLEALVRRLVFEPLALKRPRFGRTRPAHLSTGESTYPDVGLNRITLSVFPGETVPRAITHGGCPMESMESLGGWTVSPIELAMTFARTRGANITPNPAGGFTLARPVNTYAFYGLHVEGNGTVLRRFSEGNAIAITFNSADMSLFSTGTPNTEFDNVITGLFNSTQEWPDTNPFPAYQEKWAAAFPANATHGELRWQAAEGQAATDAFTLKLDGPEGTPFRLNSAALWLRFSATQGRLPAEIQVRAETNGLARGAYRSQIFVEHAEAFGDPLVVPVQLTLDPSAERPKTLRVRPAHLAPATKGQEITALTPVAEGGTPPYVWTANALPDGLALNAATGRLTGKPATEGAHEFTLTATDAGGRTADRGFTLAVDVPGAANARLESLAFTTVDHNTCAVAPSPSTTFKKTDPRIVALFRFDGSLVLGDQAVFEWIAPDGVVRQRNIWNSPATWGAGAWGTGCAIQRLNPAQQSVVPAGEWTLRITWNRHPVAESKFRLE